MDSEVRETLKKAEKSLQGLLALPDKSGVDLQTKVHALSTWITHLQTVVETLQKAGTESERLEATTKKSMQETVQPIADDQRFIKEWTEAIDKELPKLQRLEDLSTQKSFDTLGEKMKELKTVLDTLGENTKEFSTQKSIDTLHDQAKELKKALENERSLRDVAQTRAAQAESDKQSAVETAENKVSTLQSRLGPLEQFKQKAIEHAAAADAAAHERRQRIQQLEQEANGLQTRNGELTSTLTERETEIAKLRSIIGQATTERLTTNEELSRLQGVEISLRQEVSAHEGTISERNEQVKDLKTDKTNLVKYATELKSDKDTLTQANIKLETDKDKLKGEVAGLKQQLTKSEGFAAQFKADKDRLEGDIKELKQQLAKSESLAAQLRQQLTESEKSAMQLKADKERLEGEVAGLKKKGSEMQTEIDNLQQETQERAARISTLEATTAKLEAEEKRTALLNELNAELRAAKAKLEGEAETRKQELAQLKQDKSALEGDAAAFAEEKKGLEREVEDLTADRDDLQDEVDAMQLEQTHESSQSPEELFNTLIATVEGVKSQVDLIARAHASQGDSAASGPRKRQRVSSDPEQLATDWTKASSKVSERLASFSIFDDGRHDNADEIVESLAFIAGDDEKWARFAQFVELAKHNEAYCVYQMIDDNDCQQPDLLVRGVHKCTYHSAHGGYCYRAKCVMRNDVKEFIIGKKRPALRV
ncbi:hypothetical protein CCHR01_11907 [Colletotrichum chrysophilum]|uniref:Uncharacterized protein n=1 Tax=Colletotrichum chrysophilum TaxID=1836956 RepID=A0AAD9EBW6_9PEZI|nr:hypothetical protein CCHR01_11907 [Colletotrichum chrysophilum]